MSKKPDPISTLLSFALAFFMITVVLPIMAGAAGVMYAINTITYGLLPKSELQRNSKGQFLVTLDNYTNWHTRAKIETSKDNSAHLLGQYVVRAFPKVSETCHKIKNCKSYTSEFVTLDYKNANVYLIEQKDDKLFSRATSSLSSRIQTHNKQLKGNFNLNISFDDVDELEKISNQLTVLAKMQPFSDSENQVKKIHSNVVHFAKNNCRNNGVGCSVKATLIYDYSVFGGPDFLLAR
ncbi:hypothetical protein [Aliivibrio fischeri]|uniref:hypothetical protein n=1 Tax=Aliivibrio fischeri TaxID=668 RepID=UPI0007C44A64|nr:hypothetical protein [Aliivibrio fischeri]MUJ20734.1 hypothetical protein [Aliivibrio fischeri]